MPDVAPLRRTVRRHAAEVSGRIRVYTLMHSVTAGHRYDANWTTHVNVRRTTSVQNGTVLVLVGDRFIERTLATNLRGSLAI